jgi:DEAD/DEAH box helicase domain-containing protein
VRSTLRERGHVVLTNPWMLAPGDPAESCEVVRAVLGAALRRDREVHTLAGVFGSSVANVLRGLVRIARHYGSEPRFLLSSRHAARPAAQRAALLGATWRVVDEDGSRRRAAMFAVYNPPMSTRSRACAPNALEEARRLARQVVGPRHQTIFFCNRRTAVEVLDALPQGARAALGLDGARVRGYRGGYLPRRGARSRRPARRLA